MISASEAYTLAKQSSFGEELVPKAYDLENRWCFIYEDEDLADSWPIIVGKNNGKVSVLVFQDAFDFFRKIDSFKSVDVSE